MNIVGKTLTIDAARWLQEFHGTIRRLVEEACEQKWRVVSIEQTTYSDYAATLATARKDTPEYILKEITASFEVTLIENAPVEAVVAGQVMRVPLNVVECRVALMSDGTLRVLNAVQTLPVSGYTGMPFDPEWGLRRS